MATALSIIGLVSSIFTNINIPAATFAPAKHPSSTKVRVYAGLSGEASSSTSGNIPGVAVWSSTGSFIGKAMGVYNYVIGEGRSYDLEVKGKLASADYLSVSAFGTDGLCVAAVAVTSPTGYQAGWLGDVGMVCGAPWYLSNFVIPGSDPAARPACVWIDQDGSDTQYKAITMHLPSFTGAGNGLATEYNENTDTLCKSLPRFSMWQSRSVHMTLPIFNGELQFTESGADANLTWIMNPPMMESETTAPNDPTGTKLGVAKGASAAETAQTKVLAPSIGKQRAKRAIAQPQHDILVVSSIPSHSARHLCASPSSAGPDFVSKAEGLFCDMAEKALWPVCGANTKEACFDLDSKTLIWADEESYMLNTELKSRGEDLYRSGVKIYRDVQVWS